MAGGGGGRRKLLSVGVERGSPGNLSQWEADRVGDRMLARIEALEADRDQTMEGVRRTRYAFCRFNLLACLICDSSEP